MKWYTALIVFGVTAIFVTAIIFGQEPAHPHTRSTVNDPEVQKHIPPEIRSMLVVTPVASPPRPERSAPEVRFQRSQNRTSQFAGETRSVNSTCYNLRGTMASGKRVYAGAVAMNGVPFGTRYEVLSGPAAGRVFTVEDRIGHGSQFDIWMSSGCSSYGRRQISIRRLG